MINFNKYDPYKKEKYKKEESFTSYECGKYGHCRTTCPSSESATTRTSRTRRSLIIPKTVELRYLGKTKMKVLLILVRA